MKKAFPIIVLVLVQSCASNMITGSWKSSTHSTNNYKNILVAALTNHAVAKSTIESELASLLNKHSVNAIKSIDMFPPTMSNSDSDRVILMDKVRGKGIDGILTVSMLRQETESHYVDRRFPYDPFNRFIYYQSFWGYYSHWYPYSYNPTYYTETVYYFETNLYDAKTEYLVWSVQSKTYDLDDMPSFSKEFSKTIVKKLKDDDIFKNETKNNYK